MGVRSMPYAEAEGVPQFAGMGIASGGSGGGSVPIATTTTLGGVIVGDGLSVSSEGLLTSNGGIDYSTVEKATGSKWIDGKDIYVKVFPTSELIPQGSTEVQCNVASQNMNTVVFAYCWVIDPSNMVESCDNFRTGPYFPATNTNINFYFSTEISNQGTRYAIIFYTKNS